MDFRRDIANYGVSTRIVALIWIFSVITRSLASDHESLVGTPEEVHGIFNKVEILKFGRLDPFDIQ